MNEDHKVKMSHFCQTVSREGKSVRIDIYEDGEGGWLLEVVDEEHNVVN